MPEAARQDLPPPPPSVRKAKVNAGKTSPQTPAPVVLTDEVLLAAPSVLRSERRVALKVLRPELADNPGLKARLAREGQALAVSNAARSPLFFKKIAESIGYPARSIACAPMSPSCARS